MIANWEKSLAPHTSLLKYLRKHRNRWIPIALIARGMGWTREFTEDTARNLAEGGHVSIAFCDDELIYFEHSYNEKRLKSLVDRVKKKLGVE